MVFFQWPNAKKLKMRQGLRSSDNVSPFQTATLGCNPKIRPRWLVEMNQQKRPCSKIFFYGTGTRTHLSSTSHLYVQILRKMILYYRIYRTWSRKTDLWQIAAGFTSFHHSHTFSLNSQLTPPLLDIFPKKIRPQKIYRRPPCLLSQTPS